MAENIKVLCEYDDLVAIADAIRSKTGTTDKMALEDMASGISSIEGNSMSNVVKAFETTPKPTNNNLVFKTLAPIFKPNSGSVYTNTSSTLSITFGCENAGNVFLLVLALRKPVSEPVMTSEWTKIAWIAPPEGNTNDQWLYIAKYVVDKNSEGTLKTVSCDVTQGERNYAMIIGLGDYDIENEYNITYASGGGRTTTSEIYEHTLLICTSEIASFQDTSCDMWIVDNGYIYDIKPEYYDGSKLGGRLCALYIPFLSQQPFVDNQIDICIFEELGYGTSGATLCALKLKPGTPTSYEYL